MSQSTDVLPRKKILFQISGSIAAYKACEVISALVKKGHQVRCVMTASAKNFIGLSTLEGLTGHPVFTDIFTDGRNMDHINLERWADLLILCPATAGTINKMAGGLAEDPISALFLSHEFSKPYLIAPAMNHAMYNHPMTQSSLKKLSGLGLKVIPPDKGLLACGENGIGRLASPEGIIKEIENSLSEEKRGYSVLVTYGGTEEPIDEVRTLANFSGGQTGAMICDYLSEQGHSVTALASEKAIKSKKHKTLTTFRSFFDLDSLIRKTLKDHSFDAIVHLAAVSDFSIESVEINGVSKEKVDEKISSSDKVSIHLKPNFKIVERLKKYSKNPLLKVIAFKLTRTDSSEEQAQAIEKISTSKNIDYVVHNELSEIHGMQHSYRIFQKNQEIGHGQTKKNLVIDLEKIIVKKTLEESMEVPDGPMP